MQHVENELDVTLEKLTQTATKLDEKLKAYALAEGEIQALKRKISLLEEEYKKQIKVLMERLKTAESRAEYGEKTVQKLNLRVDSIITELVFEKMKTQNVNDEVDQTFELFVNH